MQLLQVVGFLIHSHLCDTLYEEGAFPDCELDIPADSANSAVHARENRLTLVCYVSNVLSFEFCTRAYLGYEISAFISVLYQSARSLRILPEVDTHVQGLAGYYFVTRRLPMATAVHLVIFVNV